MFLSDCSQYFLAQVWGLGPEPDPAEERERCQPRQLNTQARDGPVDLFDLESQIM